MDYFSCIDSPEIHVHFYSQTAHGVNNDNDEIVQGRPQHAELYKQKSRC
ncbi:hypothetical protein [Pseudoalteromonas mariniglutinosa]